MALIHALTSTKTCSGTRYHRLTCGHLIRTAFSLRHLNPCASNCGSGRTPFASASSPNTSTSSPFTSPASPASTSFLCFACYESYLHAQLLAFRADIAHVALATGQSLTAVLEQAKGKFDSSDYHYSTHDAKGWKDEFNNWYGVEMGHVRYVDVVSKSYEYVCEKKGMRECRRVGESESGDKVGSMI